MVENKKYTQWITLFDDPEDDEFDGDLEMDDEDLPRIHCTFSITQVKKPERDQGSTGMDGKYINKEAFKTELPSKVLC